MRIPFLNPDSVEDSSGISSKNRQDKSNKVSEFSVDEICTLNEYYGRQFENRPKFMSIKYPLIISFAGKSFSKVKGTTITFFPVSG